MPRILIVEDDPSINQLIAEYLAGKGCACTQAFSGTEGRLVLAAQRPDLVVMDLMLPGLSGEALLPKLAGSPVIVVSADTPDCTKRALWQHISNLRRKLASHIGRDCIEAVWRIGFRLKL